MQVYKGFRPTGFDTPGLAADRHDIGEWLVLPCSRTRDSDCLAESNFAMALKDLGGESEDVQIHRFGHWACGWYELILVRPDTTAASTAEEIEASLETYPILSEDDFGAREDEAAGLVWRNMSVRDRVHACQKYRVSVFAARHDEMPESPTGELTGYLARSY